MADLPTVLSAEVPVNLELGLRCWYCDEPAKAHWPCLVGSTPYPLCQDHLDKSKQRLVIALGGQGELHMQWQVRK